MMVTLAALILLLCLLGAAGNTAIEPVDRVMRTSPDKWADMHRSFVEQAKAPHAIAFFGDSITFHLTEDVIWNDTYVPMGAANYGIRADRTQHLLWRLQNGELDGPPPKVCIVLIGTNNLIDNTDDEIVLGIGAVVAEIRKRAPSSRVLLLGIFTREQLPEHPYRSRIKTINTALRKLEDRHVSFLDLGQRFLQSSGEISMTAIMPDFLHLTHAGYELWRDGMRNMLELLLNPRTSSSSKRRSAGARVHTLR